MKEPKKQPPEPPKFVSPALARLLAEASQGLRGLEPENPYQLYEFLHKMACRIAPLDAFYVCLYSHADQVLFFPYNVDGDIYDPPVTVPLGDGPTSQVIRRNRPLIWNTEEEARACGGLMFGQTDRFSQSAMTVPIHAHSPTGMNPPVLGALSCHAYQPRAYPPEAVQALQWLADRAGMALTQERDEAAWRYRLKAAEEQEAERLRPLVALADEFVVLLQRLGGQAEALRLLAPAGDAALSDAITRLCQECHQAQTQANQLPLRADLSPRLPSDALLSPLTPSERTVLEQLAHGKSNHAIAAALFVTEDTVKFHCKHIFQKLEVTSRAAAARVWLTSSYHKP